MHLPYKSHRKKRGATNQKYNNTGFSFLYQLSLFLLMASSYCLVSFCFSLKYFLQGRCTGNKFSQLLSDNVLILSSFLRDSFARYKSQLLILLRITCIQGVSSLLLLSKCSLCLWVLTIQMALAMDLFLNILLGVY